MKKCNKCLECKPYTDFSKDKSKSDDLNIYCRSCIKIRQTQLTQEGRCPRCGGTVQNSTKKTCENCRNIWGYDFQLVKLEDITSCAGNYVLYCPNVKGVYIGASCNLKSRIKNHLQKLRDKKHINKALQIGFDSLEYTEHFLIGINLCSEEDIYQNESNIWKILKEKGFTIFNQQKSKVRLYSCLSENKINKIYSKIVKLDNGCWYYDGRVNNDGYCYMEIGKENIGVHRVVYTLEQRKMLNNSTWEIPKKLLLRHTCHDKRCCNPEHLLLGTDKDNALDSIGRPRKKNPFKGQLITAWGETKTIGEWMCDSRKNRELSGSTIRSRLHKMSVEDALTQPLYRKPLTNEQRADRIQKRLLKEQNNHKKFQIASTIRQLHMEGESVDDLQEFFKLSRSTILGIIGKRIKYNPSVLPNIPLDYIRKKRLIPPDNVELNTYGIYVDKKFGIPWSNGYFSKYAYFTHGRTINSGRFDTAEETAKKINFIYIEHGYDPPYKFE